MLRLFFLLFAIGVFAKPAPHPLRLSLCEIDYSSETQLVTISLKLFLTDVNEALAFDPYSTALAFCQPNESPEANELLMDYLKQYFYLQLNDKTLDLKIDRKRLSGEGDNTALWIYFKHQLAPPLASLEIKNAVFTDLFFDQNNIVYIKVNGIDKSLMLNKKTQIYKLLY